MVIQLIQKNKIHDLEKMIEELQVNTDEKEKKIISLKEQNEK